MNRQQIYNECCMIRKCIEHASGEDVLFKFGFRNFPKGWCGLVSRVLGAWLKQKDPTGEYEYVCGYIGEMSHAWIEHEGIIIDITADQFDSKIPKVIVEKNSYFHSCLVESFRHPVNVNELNENPENALYTYIRKLRINKNERS